MASIREQVLSADAVIRRNIDEHSGDRGFLSQNLLAQLRNLVEGLVLWADVRDDTSYFDYEQLGPALDRVRANPRFRILMRFHGMLQASVSHYTLGDDPSERLMLKYYEYLLRTRDLARDQLGVRLLDNLEAFPIELDESMREYYDKIAARISAVKAVAKSERRDRYYIHSSRPFFTGGQIRYEVTFAPAHNRTSKFDRIIGFTDIDITDKYAAYLELLDDTIDVLGRTMPITIIRTWEVSIRPCEFDNFARLLDSKSKVQTRSAEYRNLMTYLTTTRSTLLDLIDLTEADYDRIRSWALGKAKSTPTIFSVIDAARALIRKERPGSRLLRYLMLRMNNQVIKAQFDPVKSGWLSDLRVSSGCKPFDTMPFCTSPKGHNPRFADLAESLDATGRRHELLARRIRTNVEQLGQIYTPVADLEGLGDIAALIETYNALLPPTWSHARRKLAMDKGHVFIEGYEDDTVSIIEKLQEIAGEGLADYSARVRDWLTDNAGMVGDAAKRDALESLFENSKVAVIHGAAGTGKTTMLEYIASLFADEQKLFLAHTHPAVDNLKRRVNADNSEFSTISKHVRSRRQSYDVVVVDECSTVSNANLLKVLEGTDFKLLVLVGDVYQIESIEFGNWFGTIRAYLPTESVFELTEPYRTTSRSLRTLWKRVRNLDDRIEETLSKNGLSTVLGNSLFQSHSDDEIVLCLNYDGLYGINNVNRFLQASNLNPAVSWNETTFKVGDPVLFNETDRFGPVIFNNMKGTIAAIERVDGRITFDMDLGLEEPLTEADLWSTGLVLIDGSTVRLDVFERGSTDEDDDTVNTLVPFQIAYAVSIHKAQGLEYESVKVVITDANEQSISHSIFYTAITRAMERLEVFWTPQTQQRILGSLTIHENTKDEMLLRARRGVKPVAARPKRQKTRNM